MHGEGNFDGVHLAAEFGESDRLRESAAGGDKRSAVAGDIGGATGLSVELDGF